MEKEINEPELLRAYVDTGDESAFAALVQLHLPLIYSAALRQTDGDSGLAAEIAQNVWTKFAQEAPRLTAHPSLSGWLHTTTRHQALSAVRERRRRLARESHAASMNLFADSAEPTWEQLRPLLDEALMKLPEEDRQVLLLRFFEGHGLKRVGDRLEVSDNAARMRVNRALVRLREVLGRMGIASSLAAMERLLASHAVAPVPPELFSICRTVAGGASSRVSLPHQATASRRMPLPVMWATVALLSSIALLSWLATKVGSPTSKSADFPESDRATTAESTVKSRIDATAEARGTLGRTLRLTVVDTNNQQIEGLQVWPVFDTADGSSTTSRYEADSADGSIVIAVPEDWTEGRISIGREGFADKTLSWSKVRSEEIPSSYRLRLEPGTKLSGRIVDENSRPVSNAIISAWLSVPVGRRPELVGRPNGIYVTNRADGTWETVRVSEAARHLTFLKFEHPEYREASPVMLGEQREQAIQLLAGTHVQVLRRGSRILGTALDLHGQPVAKARVKLGSESRSSSELECFTDGSGGFSFGSVSPGLNYVTIDQTRCAAGTWTVEVTNSEQSLTIVLAPVKHPLRLRFVDADRIPIPKVTVWLQPSRQQARWFQGTNLPVCEVDFIGVADELGMVTWETPPDHRMAFQARGSGFRQIDFQAQPSADIQEIVLSPTLRIVATVTDGATGLPINGFQMLPGAYSWSSSVYQGRGRHSWPIGGQSLRASSDGRLEAEFDQAYFPLQPQFPYVFRFQAQGYMNALSRHVMVTEGLVHLDVVLKPAPVLSRKIVSPEGHPIANAWIGFPGMVNHLMFSSEGPQMHSFGLGDTAQRTGSDGVFSLPATDDFGGVVAIHPDGFAVVSAEEAQNTSNLALQPWTLIEGSFALPEGQPNPDMLGLQVQFRMQSDTIASHFENNIQVSEAGHFRIPKAIVGRGKLLFCWNFASTNHLDLSTRRITHWATQDIPPHHAGRPVRVRIEHGSETVPKFE